MSLLYCPHQYMLFFVYQKDDVGKHYVMNSKLQDPVDKTRIKENHAKKVMERLMEQPEQSIPV